MKRNIGDVIDAMVQALPEGQAELKAQLLSVKGKSGYTAPECMTARWVELVEVFNVGIFGTTTRAFWVRAQAPAWARVAGAILAGEPA